MSDHDSTSHCGYKASFLIPRHGSFIMISDVLCISNCKTMLWNNSYALDLLDGDGFIFDGFFLR